MRVLITNISLKGVTSIVQVLKFTLLIYVIAFCLQLIKGAVISSILVVDNGFSESFSFWTEKSLAIVLIFCLIGIFFKATYKLCLWAITLFLIGYALLNYFNGGKSLLELTLISAISKWWLPILTLHALSCDYKQKPNFSPLFLLAVQLSIFLIFMAHGIGCFSKNALYIDYILGFFGDYTSITLKQKQAEQLLIIIGIIDILAAILVLFKPFKALIYWLIFWGFLTSLFRIVDASILNYSEFLIRVPHVGLPLVLLIFWNQKNKAENYSSSPSLPKS
ncbi:hypothetical protein [Confluentibacter citreus]|uniref:hypothetical protein n=1 Tax=Confluentibacter citreus TaxID=2007307 RepID=UPI0012FDC376|nr:hypothetical protein [Confluentibacter citreus]